MSSEPDAQSTQPRFDDAARAIVTGDIDRLTQLLADDPTLIGARSSSWHSVSLLHYVAANGVEDDLQKSPTNAPQVARVLLKVGAEVDAAAFDGGPHGTPMVALCSSVHPYLAGVQAELVEVLLDGGAAIEGVDGNGAPLGFALAFGYTAAAQVLARRGAKHENLLYAAGLGRRDLVERFLRADGSLAEGADDYTRGDREEAGRYSWPPPREHDPREQALIWACMHGHADVVELLLDRGVDVNAAPSYGQTGLHFAANLGRTEVIDLLLARGANATLVERQFNGTASDWAKDGGEDAAFHRLAELEQ